MSYHLSRGKQFDDLFSKLTTLLFFVCFSAARLRAWCVNAWDQYPGVVASCFLPLSLLPFVIIKYRATPDSAHSNKYLLYPLGKFYYFANYSF